MGHVSRPERLKSERADSGTTLSLSSSSSPPSSSSCTRLRSRAVCSSVLRSSFSSGPCFSFLFLFIYFALIQRRVRLNGSRLAHLPAVRDDRARAGLWLDAIPETERQAAQTGWTSDQLKHPGVSGSVEGEQSAGQDPERREGPEEERPHCEKSLTKTDNREQTAIC